MSNLPCFLGKIVLKTNPKCSLLNILPNTSNIEFCMLTLVMLNKMPCTLLNLSQSEALIMIVDMNSYAECQTVQIQISWLLKKPTDLDLHCLQRQSISGFSRTRVKMMLFSRRQMGFLIPLPPIPRLMSFHLNYAAAPLFSSIPFFFSHVPQL